MECFVIFVMAWCWLNATESKPQNVSSNFMSDLQTTEKQINNFKIYVRIKFTFCKNSYYERQL